MGKETKRCIFSILTALFSCTYLLHFIYYWGINHRLTCGLRDVDDIISYFYGHTLWYFGLNFTLLYEEGKLVKKSINRARVMYIIKCVVFILYSIFSSLLMVGLGWMVLYEYF